MTYPINLKGGKAFSCSSEETILNASMQAGVLLSYSCRTGRCGTCKVKVLEGQSSIIQDELDLSMEELAQGFIYTCCRRPLSSMMLDVEDLSEYNITSSQVIPAKVNQIYKFNEDLMTVRLRIPPTNKFFFLPGQYANIIYGNIKRSYSFANAKGDELAFLIKRYPGGMMSKYWFEEAKVNDILRIEGPLGSFFMRNSSQRNLLLLATGTGIAPIKSMLESGVPLQNRYERIVLLWGLRSIKDLCWELSEEIASTIEFIQVISRDDSWNGAKGYVQDLLPKLRLNFAECDVYACGNIEMIKSSKKWLIQNGLSENNFYSDAFLPS